VYDYKALPQSGAAVQNDAKVLASWSYDAAQRTMVSFDTPEIVARKAALIQQMGLGGAMYWESSADKKGADSLVSTVSLDPCLEWEKGLTDAVCAERGRRGETRSDSQCAQLPGVEVRSLARWVPESLG
jgi:hypothetical protein